MSKPEAGQPLETMLKLGQTLDTKSAVNWKNNENEKNRKIQMPKKNKPGGKPAKKAGGQAAGMNRDLTAERELKRQMAKAERFAENEEFDEALEILIPLAARFPRNDELLELLGMCYIGVGLPEQARDTFEQVIDLLGKGSDPLQRFQLASVYAMTGFPALAYDQLQQVNFAELTRDMQMAGEVNDFRSGTQKVIDEMAELAEMRRDAFMKFAVPLERGQLALQRDQLAEAYDYFQEAQSVNAKLPILYFSLGAAYESEGKLEEALAQYRHILKEIEPEDRETFGQIIRVLVGAGRVAEAESELKKLESLPITDDPTDVIRLAEAYARFEDDSKVYDLLKPLSKKLKRDSEELGETDYDQLKFLLAVAALHQGKVEEAETHLEELVNNSEDELAERTLIAVSEEEEGPRPNKRFYYFMPTVYYPAATRSLNQHLLSLTEDGDAKLGQSLRTWFKQVGEPAMDILRFTLWLSYEPVINAALLAEAVKAGVPGVAELARQITFGRAYSDPQRIGAAAAMVESGQIKADEKVTLWLGQESRIGTVEQLTADLTAELQLAMGGEDDEDDEDY